MSNQIEEALERSRRELGAARNLAEAGYSEQAISRSYFACFYAAEAALLSLGETRSKHSGVISAFSKVVIKERGLDPSAGAILRSLFDERNEADYRFKKAPPDQADSAISDALRFVDMVQDWLQDR